MQRLRSQALHAFENSDYIGAITSLDKILEVSFLRITANKPNTYCFYNKASLYTLMCNVPQKT